MLRFTLNPFRKPVQDDAHQWPYGDIAHIEDDGFITIHPAIAGDIPRTGTLPAASARQNAAGGDPFRTSHATPNSPEGPHDHADQ